MLIHNLMPLQQEQVSKGMQSLVCATITLKISIQKSWSDHFKKFVATKLYFSRASREERKIRWDCIMFVPIPNVHRHGQASGLTLSSISVQSCLQFK